MDPADNMHTVFSLVETFLLGSQPSPSPPASWPATAPHPDLLLSPWTHFYFLANPQVFLSWLISKSTVTSPQLSVSLLLCQFLSCASCILFCYSPCCLCSRSVTSCVITCSALMCLTSPCVVCLLHLLCQFVLACLTFQRLFPSVPCVFSGFLTFASLLWLRLTLFGIFCLSWTDYPCTQPFWLHIFSEINPLYVP